MSRVTPEERTYLNSVKLNLERCCAGYQGFALVKYPSGEVFALNKESQLLTELALEINEQKQPDLFTSKVEVYQVPMRIVHLRSPRLVSNRH